MTANWEAKLSGDWQQFPKFRHNLLTTFDDEPDISYLTVSHSMFEVPTEQANLFLRMRSSCTGHHDSDTVIRRSGVDAGTGRAILNSLAAADALRPPYKPFHQLDTKTYREGLLAACRIWSEQLEETGIASEIEAGKLDRNVMVGWLLETYHYIKAFPAAVEHAARHCAGELNDLLHAYAQQEWGHERFVAETLTGLGLSAHEITQSIPLVSTRSISLLMHALFERTPMAVLLVAQIVEAHDPSRDELTRLQNQLATAFRTDSAVFAPLIEHIAIDGAYGHGHLARNNQHLITVSSEDELHMLVNDLHDIKHAFDLQKLEIKDYYSHIGNYLPRQFVDYFAI